MIYGYGTYDIELGGGYEAGKAYDLVINGEPHKVTAIPALAMCAAGAVEQNELPRRVLRSRS